MTPEYKVWLLSGKSAKKSAKTPVKWGFKRKTAARMLELMSEEDRAEAAEQSRKMVRIMRLQRKLGAVSFR